MKELGDQAIQEELLVLPANLRRDQISVLRNVEAIIKKQNLNVSIKKKVNTPAA